MAQPFPETGIGTIESKIKKDGFRTRLFFYSTVWGIVLPNLYDCVAIFGLRNTCFALFYSDLSAIASQRRGKLFLSCTQRNLERRRGAAVQSQSDLSLVVRRAKWEAPDMKTIKTRDKFLTKSFLPTA